MIIYELYLIYLLCITVLYSGKKKFNKKKYLTFCFVPLILISGCRATSVGIDTQQFTDAFSAIIRMSPSDFGELRYEYGFSYLCWILGKFSTEPSILIFVSSLFINFSVARFIYKNSENVALSVTLYFLCNFFFSYMNIMRQAIAIAIILFGYEYLKERKYFKFSFFVIVASFFHGSAILALILILVRKIDYNKTFVIIVGILSFLSVFLGKDLFMLIAKFSPRLYNYVGGRFDVENYFAAFLNFVVYFISYIFGYIYIKKYDKDAIKNKNNKNNILIGIIGIAVIFSALTMKVSLFNRFTPYFSIFIIIWLPNALNKVEDKNNRILYKYIIILLFLLYCGVILIYRPEWYGVVPYSFY